MSVKEYYKETSTPFIDVLLVNFQSKNCFLSVLLK